MTTLFATILSLLFVIAFWRWIHISYEHRKFQYKVYELRDRLRLLAINGELESNSLIFDYLDFSFSKMIRKSYDISFFYMFCLNIIHPKNKEIINLLDEINTEINKSESLKKINTDYINALKTYLKEQHYVSFILFLRPVSRLMLGNNTAQKRYQDINQSSLYLPETSASIKYGNFSYS
jgi:hypothetical protein